jgi:aspartyl aminopeptidase
MQYIMSQHVKDFLLFLEKSPTSWHCVQAVKDFLSQEGFSLLQEEKPWNLAPGGKYMVSRGGSIAAFCLPSAKPSQMMLAAAHTDSPGFKLKQNPIITKQGSHFFSIEPYGSPIYHSWLNRDLALAGRCFVQGPSKTLEEKLVFLKDVPFMIPELAIHLDREVNKKGPLVNAEEHLLPLFSQEASSSAISMESILKQHIAFDRLLSFDLFVVPVSPPSLLGPNKESIASYRIDNLASVCAAMTALPTYRDSSLLPLVVFWDHEEIGSISWEGAGSTFLHDLLQRVQSFYAMDKEEFLIMKKNSLCLSLDMAHALHPLHEKKYDGHHAPKLGKGIVFKQNAAYRYATSAESLQKAVQIAEKKALSYQHFSSRSDLSCGSTVGPSMSANLGIATVDLGCAQLSMHSSREQMSCQDYLDSIAFLTQAFQPL